MNADLKTFINMISAFGLISGLSFGSHQFCNWYGCYSWFSFLRTDIICNMCTDISYHLKIIICLSMLLLLHLLLIK